jgi:hypothetical protein
LGYDITFRKPAGKELLGNEHWATTFLESFPQFRQIEADREALAQDLATDIGLTPQEYVARGIGIQLHLQSTEAWWVNVSFWDSCASVSLPNYPVMGAPEAIVSTAAVREFFRSKGFDAIDPISGEALSAENEDAALVAGYLKRQQVVGHVATLTSSTS